MKLQPVFNRKIIRFQCDSEEIYKNKNFLQNLDKLFNHPSIRDNTSIQQSGKMHTTVDKPFISPLQLPGGELLEKWMYDKILEASSHFVEFIPTKIEFVRSWANKMYINSSVIPHIHGAQHKIQKNYSDQLRNKIHQSNYRFKQAGVAIFYINNPSNGGDLIFIKDGEVYNDISEYSSNDILFANVKAGELILHDVEMCHAVSEHKNNEPRICIVVEFKYIP
jgi:hypothetical protein